MDLKKLRVLRAEKGWAQGELARRVKLSQNSYSRIERGLQFPRYPALLALADVYECEISDLILEEREKRADFRRMRKE